MGTRNAQAGEDLVPLVYRELRRRAAPYLRNERPDRDASADGAVPAYDEDSDE